MRKIRTTGKEHLPSLKHWGNLIIIFGISKLNKLMLRSLFRRYLNQSLIRKSKIFNFKIAQNDAFVAIKIYRKLER